jgi:diguanylate cyclase (GGDEF)-like protein
MKRFLTRQLVACIAFRLLDRAFGRWFAGLLSLTFFISHATLAAEKTSLPNIEYPKKISFHNIMQNQDIALGEVEAITQDHEGFMWLGGRNALLRYDGYEFLNILVANNPADLSQVSPVTQVLELLEDRSRNLWAATRSGLYRYDRNREILLPVYDKNGALLFRETIYALAETGGGELIIGAGSGLYSFNVSTMTMNKFKLEQIRTQRLASTLVSDLLIDTQGMLWVGLNDGILRIDWATKDSRLFVPDPTNSQSLTANGVISLAEDHNGDIWAGSNNGIYRLNVATGAIKHYQHNAADPHSLSDNISRQIFVDSHGWVWIGSDAGGISLYDEPNDRFLRFSKEDGRAGNLSSSTVRRIFEDNIGDLWIGTYPSGVNVYDQSTRGITRYSEGPDKTHGLLDDNVEAVETDNDGNLWIGASGVTRYNPKTDTFTHYDPAEVGVARMPSTSVMNGLIDSAGEIRFGSWGHGIQIYNKEKDRFDEVPADTTQVARGEKTGKLLNDQMIWSVTEDKQHNIWIATHFNGLTKFDKKTGLYTFYPRDPADLTSISSIVVWTTFEDSKGNFWVGTGNGLNLMDRDKGTFKLYMPDINKPRSLANSSVLTIWEDRRGRLWFGTDGGLHLYNPQTDDFTIYNAKDGFSDQGIRVILEDHSGNLWLGTNNGIVMFNPDTKLVRNFVRYNGELIGGTATGSGAVMQNGSLAFGTRTGLYIFDPDKLLFNKKAPPVVLTDFRIFTKKVPLGGPENILNKVINQTQQITLNHTQSMLSFSFAGLNFRDPDKNQYSYKLEGFDDTWREVGNQRTALYTNLPAGTFIFHVKASNNDGVWNETGHKLTLKILPPPWKSWWAYFIYAACLLALFLLLLRRQEHKVLIEREINRDLEVKVSERTAELQDAYAQLEAISLSDPLTGLNNRRYLQKVMPMDIAKVHREFKSSTALDRKASLNLTFFVLDVDYFKSVNDLYGHAAGDQLLIQLSALLKQICREFDFVVRWGGEEFLIVSRFTDRGEAPMMAERIRKAIEQHTFYFADGAPLKKTCCIGFACFPFLPEHPDSISWEQVIDIADRALFAAKRSGRNRSVGLAANTTTGDAELYQCIRDDLNQLIVNKELTVISDNNENLIWTTS